MKLKRPRYPTAVGTAGTLMPEHTVSTRSMVEASNLKPCALQAFGRK